MCGPIDTYKEHPYADGLSLSVGHIPGATGDVLADKSHGIRITHGHANLTDIGVSMATPMCFHEKLLYLAKVRHQVKACKIKLEAENTYDKPTDTNACILEEIGEDEKLLGYIDQLCLSYITKST